MNHLFRSILNSNLNLGRKRFSLAFIVTIMLFSFNNGHSQALFDNVTVDLTRVTWDYYCADGTDFGVPIGCVGNDGPDLRYRYRMSFDGSATWTNYNHLGSSTSPQAGGPVLDNESDTDGANVSHPNFRDLLTQSCVDEIRFDLDAWDEDGCGEDWLFNTCGALGNDDDERATAIRTYTVPQSTGSASFSYTTGRYSYTFTVDRTVRVAPTVTTTPADGQVCYGGTITFMSSAPAAGNSIAWFTNPANPSGSTIGAGETYNSNPITTFPYTVYCAEENGGCYGEAASVTITERAAINAPTAPGTTVCSGASAVLTATSNNPTTGSMYWYNDAALTDLAYAGNPFPTAPLTSNTTYYVVEEALGCTSPSAAVDVIVTATPINVVGTGDEVCEGETATLTATGNGGTIEWYSDGAGNNLVGTGASFTTPVLTQTTTYFATEPSGSCPGGMVAVTAIVNPKPVTPNGPSSLYYCDIDYTELFVVSVDPANVGDNLTVNILDGTSGALLEGPATLVASGATTPISWFGAGPTGPGEYLFTVTVTDANGCESDPLLTSVTIIDQPAAPTVTSAEICENETATLTATANSGENGNIEWYSDAGLTDLLFVGNSYTTPALTATTTYYVIETLDACDSEVATATVTVNSNPDAPTADDVEVCEGESAELSATPAAGEDITWYSDPSGVNVLATGPTYTTPVLTSTTTYYVSGTDGTSGCESELVAVTVTVNPKPVAPNAPAEVIICDAVTVEDAITVNSANVGDDLHAIVIKEPGDTVQDILITITETTEDINWGGMLPPDFTTGEYTIVWSVVDGNGCESDPTITDLLILDPPAAPTVTGDTEVCEGESAVLTATGNGTPYWYSDVALTDLLSVGGQYNTGELTTTTTYYVTVKNDSSLNCISEATEVTVTVTPAPTAPTVVNDTVCSGEEATLEASVAGSETITWYTDASGNNPVGTGTSYTTQPLVQTTVFYASATDPVTGCESALVEVYGVVREPITPPAVFPVVEFCEADEYVVTATVGLSGIGGTLESTLSDSTGAVVDMQSNIVTSLTTEITFTGLTPGTYTHLVTLTDDTCTSEAAVQTIIVNENPEAPVVLDEVIICSGETATLFAYGETANPNSIITWYDETTFNPIAVGWEYETQPLFLDQTFYASVTDENGCESELSPIQVIVNDNPTSTTAVNDTVCEGTEATLSVIGDAGSTYEWFTDGAGTNLVATGTTYTTPALTQTTTFYVAETNADGCTGSVIGVTAYVTPAPDAPQAADITLCVGETGELSATGSGTGTLNWYDGAQVLLESDNMPPATGTLAVGPFVASGTYFFYVSEFDGECESELTEIEVVVGEAPGAPTVTSDSICAGETATLTAVGSGGTINWYTDLALTNLVETGPQFTTPVLTVTTSYWVTESFGSCEGAAVEVEVVVNELPETPVISSNTPCEGATLELTASDAFGVTYEWNGPSGFTSNDQNPTIDNVTEANNQGTYTLTITDNITGCVSVMASIEVDIIPTPEAPSIASNGPICAGEDLVLTASDVVGATYTWYDSDNNVIDTTAENTLTITPATLADAGTYGVSVNVDGCESAISTTVVVIKPSPDAPAVSNNGPVCENDELLLIAEVVAGATYVWEGPNGVIAQSGPIVTIPAASPSDTGTYTVYIIVDGCPSEESTTEVVVNAAPVLTQNPTTNSPVCEHDTILLEAPYDSTLTYNWSGPNGYVADSVYIDTLNNFYVEAIFDANENDDQGFYTLVVTDNETGCASTEYAVLVIVNKFPDNILADNDGPVCEGDDLQLTVTSIVGAEYVWVGPDNFYSTDQNPIIENVDPDLNAGTYEVTIILGGCVSEVATTEVVIYRNPIADAGPDLTIEEGTIFQLNGNNSVDAIDFAWLAEPGFQSYLDDPTSPNPWVGIDGPLPARDEPYVFVLTVYTEFGCTDSDTVLVYVYETNDLIIPNIITPNGDGANDTWVVTYLDNLTDYTLSIYARGGSLVYKTNSYANDWSGIGIDGKELPEGTYWYTIHGLDTEGEDITFKGYIEIVR